ncbi:hypothetical protein Tco_0684928 [Tanacetum coccineum]
MAPPSLYLHFLLHDTAQNDGVVENPQNQVINSFSSLKIVPKQNGIEEEKAQNLDPVETEFPAIAFNDSLTSDEALSCEPTISSLNDNEIDFKISFDESDDEDYTVFIRHMVLPPGDQRHQYFSFEGLQYTDANIADFKMRFGKIYKREVHRVQEFDFGGLPDLMAEGLSGRMLMEHRDAQGQSTDPRQGNLSAYWVGISSVRDFLGATPSYTLIRDSILRLCHRQIACSIARRSQAPEKVFKDVHFEKEARGYDISGRLMILGLGDAADGTSGAAEDAPVVDEGALAIPAPLLVPQLPHVARTMAQRLGRLEQDVHQIRGALG